jgi:hypothetical protein
MAAVERERSGALKRAEERENSYLGQRKDYIGVVWDLGGHFGGENVGFSGATNCFNF